MCHILNRIVAAIFFCFPLPFFLLGVVVRPARDLSIVLKVVVVRGETVATVNAQKDWWTEEVVVVVIVMVMVKTVCVLAVSCRKTRARAILQQMQQLARPNCCVLVFPNRRIPGLGTFLPRRHLLPFDLSCVVLSFGFLEFLRLQILFVSDGHSTAKESDLPSL